MEENTKKESIVNSGASFEQIGPGESERRKWLIACGATGGAAGGGGDGGGGDGCGITILNTPLSRSIT